MQLNRNSADHLFAASLITLMLTFCEASPILAATIVRFDTSVGAFDVELFDTVTPITVENFLNYVGAVDYTNSIVTGYIRAFVIQGGGFTTDNLTIFYVDPVPTAPPIPNEPFISNTRGTLAMAKLAIDPDSATSQWFINLGDNSANLDFQNGGFTVFGQVLGDGMDIVDAIAALPTVFLDSGFTDVPFNEEGFVMVNDISIVPEPSTFLLAIFALVSLLAYGRRHRIA